MYQLSIYRLFHPQKTLSGTVEYPVPQQNIRCHSGTFCGTVEVGTIVLKKCRSSSDIDNAVCAIYRVIHKSLRDFRTRLRNNQDKHGINR